MTRVICIVAFLALAIVAAPAHARCTRAELAAAIGRYVAAQERGNPSRLPLTPSAAYRENLHVAKLDQGIPREPLAIDFQRDLLDTQTCETFSELIVAGKTLPHVIGAHLQVDGGRISGIDLIVTGKGDWGFDAQGYLAHSSSEDWRPLAPRARSDRKSLVAIANAYFDYLSDTRIEVPFGKPCGRLEGGRGIVSCTSDITGELPVVDRHFIVDEDIGAVVGIDRLGPNRLPISHLLRIVNGRIRYVHTLTVCSVPKPNCGFPVAPPPDVILSQSDVNHDGVTSKEEAHGPLAAFFDRIDANKDGKFTLEELKTFQPGAAGGH